MSQLNFAARSQVEHQHHIRNAKLFGASEVSRSTTKKTALTDVKNIIDQRTVNSSKKLLTSVEKSNISKRNLISIFNNKENEIRKKGIKQPGLELSRKKKVTTTSDNSHEIKTNDSADIGFVEPVCHCNNKMEDDYGDILLKNLTLTKSEIDSLATEWERSPIVSEKDMKKIEIPAEIPIMKVSISDWPDLYVEENNELDFSLLNDIPAIECVFNLED